MELTAKFTVYFEDPFWVGVYERSQDGKLEAARVVFGAEPKDCEVYGFLLQNWRLLRFSPAVREESCKAEGKKPKRLRRAAREETARPGIGTKAQQALKLQQEQGKLERRAARKQRSEEEKRRQFELRQQKKKEKHKGR